MGTVVDKEVEKHVISGLGLELIVQTCYDIMNDVSVMQKFFKSLNC